MCLAYSLGIRNTALNKTNLWPHGADRPGWNQQVKYSIRLWVWARVENEAAAGMEGLRVGQVSRSEG